MPDPNLGGKPSDSHIIWTYESPQGVTRKRFDTDQFAEWVDTYGFDLERKTRVDHERGMEERTQHRCVFAWGLGGSDSPDFGDSEWKLDEQKTPRTFVEVDEEGIARIRSWDEEFVVDVTAMIHKGPQLLVRTDEDRTLRINGEAFSTRPADS